MSEFSQAGWPQVCECLSRQSSQASFFAATKSETNSHGGAVTFVSRPLKERSLFFGVHSAKSTQRKSTTHTAMPFDEYHFNMFYCTNRKLTPSQSTTTTDAPALAAVAPVRTPTPRTTFLWTKSGRRRSPSNLKLLSANRADANRVAAIAVSATDAGRCFGDGHRGCGACSARCLQ